jgi:hypothetical protein
MPFLFQRKIGTKHEVISDTTVVNMLKRRSRSRRPVSRSSRHLSRQARRPGAIRPETPFDPQTRIRPWASVLLRVGPVRLVLGCCGQMAR